MASESPSVRPLVIAGDRSIAPEAMERSATDLTYVPGYSDKRMARDEARHRGQRGPGLAHRLQWVRVLNPRGQPDGLATARMAALGYRPLPASDIASLGFEAPPAAQIVDGKFRTGDAELWYTSATQAARNEKVWRSAVDSQSGAGPEALQAQGASLAKPGEELTWASQDRTTEITPPKS